MSGYDYSNFTAKEQRKLENLKHDLAFKQAKADIRTQYTPKSIFNNGFQQQNPYMNPYMQQPDPMQSIMDMMPMMMMMKMLCPDMDMSSIFGDMFKSAGSKDDNAPTEKLGKKDNEGWREVIKTAKKDEDLGADDAGAGTITTYKKDDGSTKTITENGAATTIVVTDKTKHTTTTEVRDDAGILSSKTVEGKFIVNPKEKKETDEALPNTTYKKAQNKYNGEGKLLSITLTGEDKDKKAITQTFTKSKDKHNGQAVFTSDKKTYILKDNQFVEFKEKKEE